MAQLLELTRNERGSALAEFVLLAGVLLPLGLGMAMIGKLTDLKQVTEQASRYTAWEATVYSRAQLGAQPSSVLETRFFQAPDRRFLSDTQQNNDSVAENPLWGASANDDNGMRKLTSVSRIANQPVSSQYAFDTGNAKASLVTGEIAAAAGRPLSGFKGNSWGIVADGLLRSSVAVAVKTTGLLPGSPAPCGTADSASSAHENDSNRAVCIRGAGVILADGWAASGEAQAKSRVRSLVPASTMQKVGEGVGKLLGSTIFPELDPLDKAFGHVDMRVLPEFAQP